MLRLLWVFPIFIAACAPGNLRAEPSQQSAQEMTPSPVSRCMNMGNALESPAVEGEWGYTIRAQDLEMLAADGFDTVRVPIRWSSRTGVAAPYTIDPDFFLRVDEVIAQALAANLKVIINVHHYNDLSEQPDMHEPRLEAIWAQIGERYATFPDTLIFEIINEPYGEMTIDRTDALNQKLLSQIRQTNPDRWVIYGTGQWGNLEGLTKSAPEYAPKVMLTYHEYSPFEFTHQGAFWTDPVPPMGKTWGSSRDLAKMSARQDKALAFQTRHAMPILVGEFGVYHEVPIEQRAAWLHAQRQGFEARGFGWCHWDFATTLKAYDQQQETWLPEIKAALLGD